MINLLQEYFKKRKANTQIAHFVFCQHTGKRRKTKRAIFIPTLDRK